MSSARRSSRERREDWLAAQVRTPEEAARMALEGRRLAEELLEEALAAGLVTADQAAELRAKHLKEIK